MQIVVEDLGIFFVQKGLVFHIGNDVVAVFLHESLAKARCPKVFRLHFPRVDEHTRFGAFVGLGQTTVHLFGIAVEGVVVEVIEDAGLAGEVPSVTAPGRLNGVEIVAGLVAVG